MDVRASSDPNTPLIMHDSTVGRTTNVSDPRVVPEGTPPPSPQRIASMKENILAARGTNYPAAMDPATKNRLENDLNAQNTFSPYGNISESPTIQPVAGTTYGRNPKVKDLTPETLTGLHLLKYQDPAPRPSINHDGTLGQAMDKAWVSTEKVQTVQSLLRYAADNKIKSAIVFDVIERESLTAITKILAADTNTFINGRKAKDVVVLKYRGNLEPDVNKLMTELKDASISAQYPQGFYPNLIGILAKYFDKPGVFSANQYVDDWIKLRKTRPQLPLISLDTVVTSPDQGSTLDLVARLKNNNIAIGSFHDVPSYRGGDQYPQSLVDKRLYFLSNGICCRSTDSTGDPQGTPDQRYDYSWMIAGNTSNSAPSGMITSDNPMPILKKLESLNLRKKALNAYKRFPVGEYDGQYNQIFNVASEGTLGVGGSIVSGQAADRQNTNYRKNNIWAFEWISGDTYRIKLLEKEYGTNNLYLTNDTGEAKVLTRESGNRNQQWTVRRNPTEDFLMLESASQEAPGVLGFEGNSWAEGTRAAVGTISGLNSTRKWQIRVLDASQDLPLNPQQGVKIVNQYTDRLQVGVNASAVVTKNNGDYWVFTRNLDGSYQLQNQTWGKIYALDCTAVNGRPLYAGGGVCNNWLIIKEPGDSSKLSFFNLTTGKVMDFGDRTTENREVYQWESIGISSQQFSLVSSNF